jgi:hypothetical protein
MAFLDAEAKLTLTSLVPNSQEGFVINLGQDCRSLLLIAGQIGRVV